MIHTKQDGLREIGPLEDKGTEVSNDSSLNG